MEVNNLFFRNQSYADTRSVDELVSFINQGKSGAKSRSKSSKAAKRARQRERKKQRKNQLKGSQEKEPEKEGSSTSTSNNKEKEKEKNNKGTLNKSQERDGNNSSTKQTGKAELDNNIDNIDDKERQNDATAQQKANGLKRSGEEPERRVEPVDGDKAPNGTLSSSNGTSTMMGEQHEHNATNNSKKRATGGSIQSCIAFLSVL